MPSKSKHDSTSRVSQEMAEKRFARAPTSNLPASPQSDYLVTVVHLRLTDYPLR